MKTKIMQLSLLLPLFCCASCSDFLEYNETTDYGKNDLLYSYDRMQQMATNVYSYMDSELFGGAMRATACDEAEYAWDNSSSAYRPMNDGSWSAFKTVDDKWASYYMGIRSANFFLTNGVGLTFDQNKYAEGYDRMMTRYNNLEWEVRFLRAYYYFELSKRYGGVPLVTKVLTGEEANNVDRASYDEIIKFIVDECDSIGQKLPVNYSDDLYNLETGRVPRAAVYALKARALLYAASELHNPVNSGDYRAKWDAAVLATKMMVDSAKVWGYNRLPVYEKSFNNYVATDLIFARRLSEGNQMERANYPIGVEGGNSGNCPTQNLVNAFGMKKATDAFDPYDYSSKRDYRLTKTVVYNGLKWANSEIMEIWEGGNNALPKTGASPTGYYLQKYLDKDISFKPNGITAVKHVWVIFGYPEVLLNYAEAMAQVYAPDEVPTDFPMSARDAINELRGRTKVAVYDIIEADPQKFKDIIRNERFAELAFQDHRFWDIRRWKIAGDEKVRKIFGVKITKEGDKVKYEEKVVATRFWNDRMYYYPISQTEVFKNSKLGQNPGWN